MPEGHVSTYSDDCELQKMIAEKGGYCSKDCPFRLNNIYTDSAIGQRYLVVDADKLQSKQDVGEL